jgi:putative intracellular protease/amidase
VLKSHDRFGNPGRKTGFWWEEFAAPYFVFRDAGVELTLASPVGGQPRHRSEERFAGGPNSRDDTVAHSSEGRLAPRNFPLDNRSE